MPTVFIGNQFNDDNVGDLGAIPPAVRRSCGYGSGRLIWGAEPGDLLVVPQQPSRQFWSYACAVKGIGEDDVRVLVPPPGSYGTDVIDRDRFQDGDFQRDLRAAITERGIEAVRPFYFSALMARFAGAAGLTGADGDHAFCAQDGADLLNSKSVFRAVAAGRRIAIPEGTVCRSPDEVVDVVQALFARGECAILKQDFLALGMGNKVLSPYDGVDPRGASGVVVLPDAQAVRDHVSEQWPWYTSGGQNKLIVERFVTGCVPLYAEVAIGEGTVEILNHGEMKTDPLFCGFRIPARMVTDQQCDRFLVEVVKTAEAVAALGYQGLVNIDGIITPDDQVLVNEFNGRLGGCTHLHEIATRLLGPDYFGKKLLSSHNRWAVPSFAEALRFLADEGIAFDRTTGTGVLLPHDNTAMNGMVEYCVVADSDAERVRMENLLDAAFQG
jgi:Pre ATP-grasp domain/PGM1 C-terminal domain